MPERLFWTLFGSPSVDAQLDDSAWLQAMLDAEAALARAAAVAGVIPNDSAQAIAAACRADAFDAADLGRVALRSGNPVVPLVAALRDAVGDEARSHVHVGATSQDIVDTAMSLVARRALGVILGELREVAAACATLAAAHRETPMSGRTLLQQAVPTTFGLKSAGWLTAVDESRVWLTRVRDERLAAQLGGPAGTLATFGSSGTVVVGEYARVLGLAEPVVSWHTDRTRMAELASALGAAAGALGKIALDVVLLAQTEVAEVEEGESGGSSSMPHKRNPIRAVLARACARRVPALAATMLGAMPQEHERAAGGWHAEWETLSDLLRLTGGAATHVHVTLSGLRVHAGRMRANLDATLDVSGDVRAAGALVDRALDAHRDVDLRLRPAAS